MKNYSDITLKYLHKNKKRTIFTIIGIILSLSLISGVGFLGLSFKDYMYNRAIEGNGDYEFGFHEVDSKKVNILKNDVDLEQVGVNYYGKNGTFTLEGKGENTIHVDAEDEVYMNEIVSHKLTEGRFPTNSSELIINSKAKGALGINLNDKVKLREVQYDGDSYQGVTDNYKEYTIVGFIKEQSESGDEYFYATTLLCNLQKNKSYGVFFTVSNSKNKMDLVREKAQNLGISEKFMDINNDLLSLRGEGIYEGRNTVIQSIVIFVLLIIILATIFLIYNAINISVTERMTQFGILRSIGATPKQVRNLVLREGLVMCLISIPFGIVGGFLGVWTTVKILDTQIANMLGSGILDIKFYPVIILFTLMLGAITIVIASFGPARKAGKVSPITVVKGNTDEEKIKYYNGNIIRKAFGIEGWIAYKNIRKNSKRFAVTILSLSISLIMFITFTSLNMKRIDELDYINKSSVSHGTLNVNGNSKEIADKVKKVDGVGEVYIQSRSTLPALAIDKNLVSDEYINNGFYYNDNGFFNNADIQGFSKNSLKEVGLENGLKDNEVVLVNNVALYDENGKLQNIDITNLKEGDTFKLPVSNFNNIGKDDFNQLLKDKQNENYLEFKVKKVISKNPFNTGYSNAFMIIMDYDAYNKLEKGIHLDDCIKFKYSEINNKKLTESASQKIKEISNEYGVTFIDNNKDNKSQEQMWTVISVFIYGFIVMVTLIGVVNVINTISLNILIKKKEFGTLGTIGMNRGQINKMVMLEGSLYGVISSIIGGVLSVGLTAIAIRIFGHGFTVTNRLYWQPFIIGFAINLIVVIIASLIPLNKLKKMSLVETIKNIE